MANQSNYRPLIGAQFNLAAAENLPGVVIFAAIPGIFCHPPWIPLPRRQFWSPQTL
jgi:hypothetical protein